MTILDKIIEQKKKEVNALREQEHILPDHRLSIKRPFIKALLNNPGLAIIAEVKKASPSKGLIRPDFDPVAIAQSYERGGANCVSVLTDENFFQGSNSNLIAVREAITLPVIRKDFIIDPLQVRETALIGADAMLLIAAALDDSMLEELYKLALSFDIDPLIEVHTREELDRVMRLEPPLIGINNRNLSTFVTDINTSVSLRMIIPKGITVVAESGIENGAQAQMLKDAGLNALLVGESLMRRESPESLIKELALRS